MELQQFVTDTLLSIINGVSAGQRTDLPRGAFIGHGNALAERKEYNVEFDVALGATKSGTAGGKIGVALPIVGVQAGADRNTETTSASRVRFSMPVVYPTTLQTATTK